MKRILVITNNLQQASYRLRIAAILPALAEREFELTVEVRPRGILARRRLLASADQYDGVLLQRKLLDPWDAKLLRKKARRIVYDVDDAVMFDEKPRGRFSQWRLSRRFDATASIVDCAVVGNDYLAGMFLQKTKNVIVLPTVVDASHYQVKRHDSTESPRLVWIGSHSTLPYLRPVLGALVRAREQLAGLRLLVIADESLVGNSLPIEFEKWSEATEAELLCRGDIGIAPTPLNHWTLGKCGLKIVQYMAAGLPVIASPVGANGQIVQEGRTGFLADSGEAWTEAVMKLANDVALRQTMGAAGRQRVENQYSLQRAVETWTQVLGM
jgi:glycosyltransferase involved in cell wall biosynthesis